MCALMTVIQWWGDWQDLRLVVKTFWILLTLFAMLLSMSVHASSSIRVTGPELNDVTCKMYTGRAQGDWIQKSGVTQKVTIEHNIDIETIVTSVATHNSYGPCHNNTSNSFGSSVAQIHHLKCTPQVRDLVSRVITSLHHATWFQALLLINDLVTRIWKEMTNVWTNSLCTYIYSSSLMLISIVQWQLVTVQIELLM